MGRIAVTHFRAVMEHIPDLHIEVDDFCGSVGRCVERVTGMKCLFMDIADDQEIGEFTRRLPLVPKWTAHEGAVRIYESSW